jgi:hypothetical protein
LPEIQSVAERLAWWRGEEIGETFKGLEAFFVHAAGNRPWRVPFSSSGATLQDSPFWRLAGEGIPARRQVIEYTGRRVALKQVQEHDNRHWKPGQREPTYLFSLNK